MTKSIFKLKQTKKDILSEVVELIGIVDASRLFTMDIVTIQKIGAKAHFRFDTKLHKACGKVIAAKSFLAQ